MLSNWVDTLVLPYRRTKGIKISSVPPATGGSGVGIAVGPGVLVLVGVGAGGVVVTAGSDIPNAAATSSSPPNLPAYVGLLLSKFCACPVRALLISMTEAVGISWRTNAAAPLTKPVAIDVPLQLA